LSVRVVGDRRRIIARVVVGAAAGIALTFAVALPAHADTGQAVPVAVETSDADSAAPGDESDGTRVGDETDGTRVGDETDGTRVGDETDGTRVGGTRVG